MRTLEIVLWTFGVFFAAVLLFFFFPIGITVLGFLSIGLIAREIGNYYDEVYAKAARERDLDRAHKNVKVIRIKRSTAQKSA